MLFDAIFKAPRFLPNFIIGVALVFLWASSLALLTKALGTLGLLALAWLFGWYGAALRHWLDDRQRLPR